MKIIETKGKFRKSKAYGLIGCLALFSIIATNPILNVKAEEFNRTDSGQVDNSNTGVNKLIPSEEIKSVPNGEKNFNATVAFTTEAGLGSGTLVSPDTVVTVAHNFVHLNEKTNPISVENNVNKDGDVHIATLPNGEHSKFSNADVHYWNREGFVQGYKNDLAVVKLKNSLNSTPPAEITDNAKKLENGDKIHVFGYPKGKLEPIVNGTVENTENYGANIYGVAYQGSKPGASGGGLYDADGKLIGVNQNGVEGLRSGGITFSKEQLDWINSIVRGENAKPVYLEDKPKTDNKEEVHPKHGKLLYTDENVTGMIGKLYEDGTYIMKSNGKENMILDNPNRGINSMFYGLTDKDGQPLSAEEVEAIKNKVKRIEVDGKIVADKLSTDVSNNTTTELDLTGVTLSDKAEEAPFLAYYADNLTKLTLDSKLSLSNVKNVDRIIDNAPNLKLTNEQVTQLLKDTKFENSYGIFNNVGIERLDLTSFDNSKLNNSNVLFKNLKGLKEIAFGDKFYNHKYVPTGKSNSYFDTDLSAIEKVSFSRYTNDVFIKEWLKAVKDANIPKKEAVYKDGINIGTLEEVLNKTDFETGVYTIGEANAEVNMHVYYEFSIKDGDKQIEREYLGNKFYDDKGKIIKTEEVFPESGKWHSKDTVDSIAFNTGENFRLEYDNDVYKIVGSSETTPIAGVVNVEAYKEQYDRAVEVWHEGDNVGLFYSNEGKAANGKIFKKIFYLSPVRGSYTQTFVDEDQAKAHENDENYNPENYSIKETYFSGYHKLTDNFVLPKAPQYIQKDNKIYKLSSHDAEPTMEKYQDGNFFTDYKYKVIYDNTTKESIKEIQPKTIYEADERRDRNTEDVKIEGSKGVIKTITTYKVDDEGNLTENTLENNEKEVVNTIVKVGTKPKVEFLKENNRVVKRTTTYTVNSETGEVVTTVTDKLMSNTDKEPPIEEKSILKNIPDDIEKTTISHKVKYIPNYDKEFGYNKVLVEGKDGVTTKTTSYIIDENGNVTSNVKENVIASVDEELEIGLKTKTEIITEDGKKIERITKYELDENTGNISKKIENKILNDSKDKIISTNTPVDDNGNQILPPVLDKLEYNGAVNSIEPPVEEKPEYTGPVSTNTPIDDKGELITPPVVEKPEFNGGVNPIDPPVVEIPEYNGGVVPLDPPVVEIPEYNGGVVPLDPPVVEIPEYNGGVVPLDPPVVEIPEFNGGVTPIEPPIVEVPEYNGDLTPPKPPVIETPKEEPAKSTENKPVEPKQEKVLPNTNSTSVLASLVSSVIGTLGLGYKSKRRK